MYGTMNGRSMVLYGLIRGGHESVSHHEGMTMLKWEQTRSLMRSMRMYCIMMARVMRVYGTRGGP